MRRCIGNKLKEVGYGNGMMETQKRTGSLEAIQKVRGNGMTL